MHTTQIANTQAQQLIDVLRAEPEVEAKARAIEEAEHLQRAIQAFHMEAIRFHSYTLHRQLTQAESGFSDRSRAAYQELRDALEESGLTTR